MSEVTSYASYITVSHGMSGYYAVMMHFDGFWEPWNTGSGRYEHKEQAISEAKDWAQAEGLEFRE